MRYIVNSDLDGLETATATRWGLRYLYNTDRSPRTRPIEATFSYGERLDREIMWLGGGGAKDHVGMALRVYVSWTKGGPYNLGNIR
jgi:hypothetical protein